MKWLAVVIALLGCSGKHAQDTPAPAPLVLVGDDGHGIITLAPNDAILDGTGALVGHVDWKTPEVIVGEVREALAFDIEPPGITITTTMGAWHVAVDGTRELRVDGKPAGKLTGVTRSKEGWRRLAALVLAIPMLPLPPVAPAPPDAAPEIVAPTPPPPPPSH